MPGAKKRIIIVGNSGFARECFIMLRKMQQQDAALSFGGFLSFEGYQADLKELSSFFLGTDDDYIFSPDEYAVIGIGNPALRQKAYSKLKEKGVAFFTVIHPEAYVDVSSSLGEGNVLGARCYVTCNCTIGAGNVFNGLIHVGHDTIIGDCNFFGPGTQVLGNVRMGSLNAIGATSVLMPGCKVGDRNTLAPLSALYKGCKNDCYMAGNPAIKIGMKNI